MNNALENPPAFPSQPLGTDGLPSAEAEEGMSLRDHYAGLAMQGLLANPNTRTREFEEYAEAAYAMADAMLVVRSRT